MENFRKLNLNETALKAIERAGFTEPSEIQSKTIPLVLAGKDVLASSATGSGKTLAFGLGMLEKITTSAHVQALILTPTRELAEQVSKTLKKFSHGSGTEIVEIYGGMAMGPQISAIKRANIVVGTPGRILDHIKRETLDLSKIKFLVLDEADKMFEMGFIEDVRDIIDSCSEDRQTLLFSATISHDIEKLAGRYMKDPVVVEVESYVDASKLVQKFYDVPDNIKFSLLVHLLRQEKSGLVMVFCNTRRTVDFIAKGLKKNGIHAMAIHGGLSQNRRNHTLEAFHSHEAVVLVCTDVAARGIDVKNISHVYNYDLPKNSTEYIHRIGRTARAGKEGIAISLVGSRDHENFRNVLRDDSLDIQQEAVPEVERVVIAFSSDRDNFRGRRDYHRGSHRGRSHNYRRRY